MNHPAVPVACCVLTLLSLVPLSAHGQAALTDSHSQTTNSVGMVFVPIPAGRFTMGSPPTEKGSDENETLHKVELTEEYRLSITEVTEAQWALVMEEAARTEIVEVRDPDTGRFLRNEERQIPNPRLRSQKAMTNVKWEDAVEFCRRLSEMPEEKKTGFAYRLPTEAEWEYACRAGTSTAYCFADEPNLLNDYAWHHGNSENSIQEVARKKPNAWGLFDMHGNASEWTQTLLGSYPEGLVEDPLGPDRSSRITVRGGSYRDHFLKLRCAQRIDDYAANNQYEDVGFRIVQEEVSERFPDVINSINQRFHWVPPYRIINTDIDIDSTEMKVVEIKRGIYLLETEVTQAQWKEVMGTEPWKEERHFYQFGQVYPAHNLTWIEAQAFCRKLSELPAEKAAGRAYRLPTSAEWEIACRAGSAHRLFWGDDYNVARDFAWFYDEDTDLNPTPRPVAKKKPNAWGFYDMAGNVEEWCEDARRKESSPDQPYRSPERIYRGGCWYSSLNGCYSGRVSSMLPDTRWDILGLRIVMEKFDLNSAASR